MENDSTDTEVIATEAGRGSGIWNAVGVSCLAATTLVAAGYVAAAIVEEVGGQVPSTSVKAYTLLLATDWSAPYFAVIPLVAIAIAWWQLRGLGRSRSAAGAPAPSPTPPAYAEIIRLLRARALALTGAALLLIVAAAAVGSAIGNFIYYNNPSVPGAELWASEVERLANALATLAICGAGIAAALMIQRSVRSRLPAAVAMEGLGDLDDAETVDPEGDEPVADPVAGEPANL
ncbi:MAG: hypothetical protein WB802_14155 [Candidatus Dormiibacterota bacterium]